MLAVILAAVLTGPSPPVPSQYVTDTQGALSAQTRANVDAELRAYEKATGHQVIVYIGGTTGGEPFEEWTVDTAERWGIGRKHHDDGAVLFILMKDHRIRIEVGYGLEPYLTDAQSFWIIENTIEPKMRSGDVDGAVQEGVDSILTTITPSYASKIGHAVTSAPPSGEESTSSSGGGGLGNGLLGVVIFLCFFWVVLLMIFVAGIRYLTTLVTHGPSAAAKAWHDTWISSGSRHGSMWYGGGPFFGGFGGFGGGFGGGFSAGGGGFGGGGASGGW
jgi:uncharacterized protein